MKKLCSVILILLLCGVHVYGQQWEGGQNDPKQPKKKSHKPFYKFGIGLEDSWPFGGVSARLGLSASSVLQVIVSPFSEGDYSLNRYTLRYNYNIPNSSIYLFGPHAHDFFFVYGEAGLITWTDPTTEYVNSGSNGYYETHNSSYSNAAYGLGAGYEVIFSGKLGVYIQGGYGIYGISNTTTLLTGTGGLGAHYYFGGAKPKKAVKKQDEENKEKEENKDDDEKNYDKSE